MAKPSRLACHFAPPSITGLTTKGRVVHSKGVEGTGRVLGSVITSAFRGLDHDARQQRVWKYLEDALTPEEMQHVGPIVTLTPAEANIDVGVDG